MEISGLTGPLLRINSSNATIGYGLFFGSQNYIDFINGKATFTNNIASGGIDFNITGSGGTFRIKANGASFYASLSSGLLSADRTISFPDASVTLVGDTSTQTLTNKTITSGKFNSLTDTNGNTSLDLAAVTSAVNYVTLYNGGTGASPKLVATGTDTNISLQLESKGTGTINFQIGTTYLMSLPTSAPGSNTYLKYNGSSYVWDTAAGGGLTVGTSSISSGTAGRILFEGAGNVLQQSANLLWDNTNSFLSVGSTLSNDTQSPIWISTNVNNFYHYGIKNSSAGTNASSEYSAIADTGTLTTNFFALGINNSGFNGVTAGYPIFGSGISTYLIADGGTMYIGTQSAHGITFYTGGVATTNARISISSAGAITGQTSQDVFNTTSTTINAFGAATAITLGATTGTLTLRNPTIVSSQATLTLFNTTSTNISFGGAATTWTIGATSGTMTIRNTTVVGSQTSATLWNTVATTVSFAGAATTLTIGGTPTGSVTHNYSTNATASPNTKTINFGTAGASGSTTAINIGSSVAGSTSNLTLQGHTTINVPVRTSTSSRLLTVITPADTTLTASTESILIALGGDASQATVTRQFATGAIALQRDVVITGATYAAVASSTITDAIALDIAVPLAGTNVAITNSYALRMNGDIRLTHNNGVLSAAQNLLLRCGTSNSFTIQQGGSTRYAIAVTTGLHSWATTANASGTTAGYTFVQANHTGGAQPGMLFTGGTLTGQTATTEINDINFNLARTVTWAAGAITLQRAFLISAPTYAFASSSTITTAATLAINAAPTAGSNATITDSLAFLVQAGSSKFVGDVSIGLAAGTAKNASALLDLVSTTSGLGLPSMTSAQRTSISSPRDGLLVYQSDSTPAVYARINSAWKDITSIYRTYQFSLLGEANSTTGAFAKASDVAQPTGNPSGAPTTTSGNPGINNGTVDPYIIPKGATITSLRIKFAGAGVGTGTVGTPVVRFRIYRVDYSTRTQLGSDIDITISSTGVGTFGNSSGDAFQTAVSSALSISVNAGDLIGIEFVPISGSNDGVNSIRRVFAVLETVE